MTITETKSSLQWAQAVLTSAFFVFLPSSGFAADLSKYIGKDAAEGSGFYDVPDVRRSLIRTFGQNTYDRIKKDQQRRGQVESTSDPQLGLVLVIGQTEYGNNDNDSVVILKADGTAIAVCMSGIDKNKKSTGNIMWRANGWSKALTKIANGDAGSCRGGDVTISTETFLAEYKAARSGKK